MTCIHRRFPVLRADTGRYLRRVKRRMYRLTMDQLFDLRDKHREGERSYSRLLYRMAMFEVRVREGHHSPFQSPRTARIAAWLIERDHWHLMQRRPCYPIAVHYKRVMALAHRKYPRLNKRMPAWVFEGSLD